MKRHLIIKRVFYKWRAQSRKGEEKWNHWVMRVMQVRFLSRETKLNSSATCFTENYIKILNTNSFFMETRWFAQLCWRRSSRLSLPWQHPLIPLEEGMSSPFLEALYLMPWLFSKTKLFYQEFELRFDLKFKFLIKQFCFWKQSWYDICRLLMSKSKLIFNNNNNNMMMMWSFITYQITRLNLYDVLENTFDSWFSVSRGFRFCLFS